MKLLVVGLRGTGVEIAKNCLLQGVSSLTLSASPRRVVCGGARLSLIHI